MDRQPPGKPAPERPRPMPHVPESDRPSEHPEETLRELALAYLKPIHQHLDERLPDPATRPAFRFDPIALTGPPRSHGPLPPPAAPSPIPAPAMEELPWVPLTDLSRLLRRGEVTAIEVVQAYAKRIHALDPVLHAYITPTVTQALVQAEHPRPGRLSGIPIALKDIIDVAGFPTTAGSRLLKDRIAPASSTIWERLAGEGALLLGKLHTHEFAAGATGENEAYGPARNPWDPSRITGGSSSGAGAAVSAALASAALGSDTGGSIRVPAALCGTVGFKPTYGLVPTDGVVPLSWSLDHVGPLTRTVRDSALLLDVMVPEFGDSCERAARSGGTGELKGVRIGVPTAWLASGMTEAVNSAFAEALKTLSEAGAEVQEIETPASADFLMAINRAIALAEASTWHERFLKSPRVNEYGANVRPRKEAGRLIPATLYLKAQELRAELCQRFQTEVFSKVDVLALPTVPLVAPRIGTGEVRLSQDQEVPITQALLGWVGPFNVLAGPAISVPMGLAPEGLPTGLELAGMPGDDAFVLYVAAAYEIRRSPFSLRPPEPALGLA